MTREEANLKLTLLNSELIQLESAYEMTNVPSLRISISNKIIALKNKIYRTSLY